MSATPKYGITELVANQASAEIVINEALELLDAVTNARVVNRTTTAPPGSPTVGDCYIIAASATGDWSGKDGQFAFFGNGGWRYVTIEAGFHLYDIGATHFYGWDGTTWKRTDN